MEQANTKRLDSSSENRIEATDGQWRFKISGDTWFIWGVVTIAALAVLGLAGLVRLSG